MYLVKTYLIVYKFLKGEDYTLLMKQKKPIFKYHYDYDFHSDKQEFVLQSSHDNLKMLEYVPGNVSKRKLATFSLEEEKRPYFFIIPMSYSKYPLFMKFLQKVEDKFGFNYGNNDLNLPYDPSVLDHRIDLLNHSPIIMIMIEIEDSMPEFKVFNKLPLLIIKRAGY